MPQSLACLSVHLIFSTKDREPTLSPSLAAEVYPHFGGILRPQGAFLMAAGGMPDHVHLLVSLGRTLSIADAARLLKANSSKWLHETKPQMQHFAWQAGYAAFAVSYSHLDRVRDYIERQEEHHRRRTFQDELRLFLRRHRIEFDERWVWE
jgi:putative transposase